MTLSRMDDFVVGDGASGIEYILHTKYPRFIAAVYVEGVDDGMGIDPIGGLTYTCPDSDSTLCQFVWWDKPPTGPDLDRLLHRAGLAVLERSL